MLLATYQTVKYPVFDNCIKQLLYLFKCHEEYCNTTQFPGYIQSILKFSLQYKFILHQNKMKMCGVVYQYPSLYRKAFKKRRKNLKIQKKNNSQSSYELELFEHRQKLRQQLLLQQQNIVPGDLCTLKRSLKNISII